MKIKFSILFLSLSLAWASAQTPWSKQMVKDHGLGNFKMNKTEVKKLSEANWDYVSGLVAYSVLKAWEYYPEESDYYNQVKAMVDRCVKEDGSIIKGSTQANAIGLNNVDDIAAGKLLITIYNYEVAQGNGEEATKYKLAADKLRNLLKYKHKRIDHGEGKGGFIHKESYPDQMWLDGLYMAPAFYAEWQAAFGSDSTNNYEAWSDIALQFKILNAMTYDKEKGINYHAWSASPEASPSFWANKTAPFKGASKEFWGRSMGWYFAALVDVLEVMPKNHPDYKTLADMANQVASGLKRWQDQKTGCWYQLLQHNSSVKADGKGDIVDGKTYNIGTLPNYIESSCSSMFTYAYFKGVRLGILNKAEYLPVAQKAFQGLLDNFIQTNGNKTIDIKQSCASAGLGPWTSSGKGRTGTINYYLCGSDVAITENEGKAIGPFIMAAVENERMLKECDCE